MTITTLPIDAKVPRHVAIIMDGNGRWAKERGFPRSVGHFHGAEALRRVIRAAPDYRVETLTVYGFSLENWLRPLAEIKDLMELLRQYLRSEIDEMREQGVRFRAIGERARLPQDIQDLIEDAEQQTAANTRLTLQIALSYGGRQEIANATRLLAKQAAAGLIDPESIDETVIGEHLFTAQVRDPDLIIRTSGEQRLSNFLLWQSAYSEFVFLDKYWPDFSRQDLAAAIEEFLQRDRRFGAAVSSG